MTSGNVSAKSRSSSSVSNGVSKIARATAPGGCSVRWIEEFGYITIPTLAGTAFALCLVLLGLAVAAQQGGMAPGTPMAGGPQGMSMGAFYLTITNNGASSIAAWRVMPSRMLWRFRMG